MKSVKKINKAIGQFDKIIKDIKKARDAGFNEMCKNSERQFNLKKRFNSLRVFVYNIIIKLNNVVDRKENEMIDNNTEIGKEVGRANRVSEKLKDLLK